MIELKNTAESLVYSTEKTLKDAGDKVSADVKTQVQEKVDALKAVKDGEDTAAIKKSLDELGEVIQKVGAEMYKAAEAGNAQDTKPEDTAEEAKTEEPKS